MLSLLLVLLLFLEQGLSIDPPASSTRKVRPHEYTPGDIVAVRSKFLRPIYYKCYYPTATHPAVILGPPVMGKHPIATISSHHPDDPPQTLANKFHPNLKGYIRLAPPYRVRADKMDLWRQNHGRMTPEDLARLKLRMETHVRWTPSRVPSTESSGSRMPSTGSNRSRYTPYDRRADARTKNS